MRWVSFAHFEEDTCCLRTARGLYDVIEKQATCSIHPGIGQYGKKHQFTRIDHGS